jgi:signal transduction histidine kinase
MAKFSPIRAAGLNRASRHAGLRLSLMLALLLVPVVSLLYFYSTGAMKDIRLGERQTIGTGYLKKITTVYVDVLRGQTPEGAEIAGLKVVPAAMAVRKPSLREEADALAEQLSLTKVNDPTLLWQLRTLTLDAATVSDLALGEYRDQQLLALAISTHLPELSNQVKAAEVSQFSEASQTEFAVLRSLAFQALSEAVKEDASGEAAKALNPTLSDFDDAAEKFDDALLTQNRSDLPTATAAVIQKINALSIQSLAVIATQIENRTQSSKRQLALVLASIALATLFALGFAVHMVKATFRELDTVEAAKETLITSEAQAVAFAEDLQKLNGDVATLNVELTQNFKLLQETQDDNIAKSKMAQLGALTAMVAHELRNPLGSVRTSSFTIDKLSRKAGIDFSKQTGRIAHAVERCDATISQLLHYAASTEINLEDVVLVDWLEQLLNHEAAKLPTWLEMDFLDDTHGMSTRIDKKKLGHSIASILANTVQAYATTRIEGDNTSKKVEIRSCVSDHATQISITDFGPGIPEDKLPLVKEPLFTTKSFGPGLGLAIADQVVKKHGGNLVIASDSGKGTRVTISLPVSDEYKRLAA